MSDMRTQRLPALANVDEVATYLNVSPKTIYDGAERFEIPFIKVGRHLRFNLEEVLTHFSTKTREARSPVLNRILESRLRN